jgi:hypothetical protein
VIPVFYVTKWNLPLERTFHINVDAAIFKTSKRMRVDVVIRNHKGICLAACSELLHEVATPELVATRRAFAFASEEGFD